ncbi:MAG TPA: hypothetical protein P5080_04070 [Candidatus Paceibacterota bacterium]|nr:hypothetical protein [Candidatus Pacearchaeota archaeon]HRZ51142.1 hypothetical protein [Candidatus Paceibacterota bacterium]HSA36851.1 hypothetical protein [Candidatus Paceibacterota bacterium]
MDKKEWQIGERTSEFELCLACGDLAIIAELIRKGSLTGMVEASQLLWNLWPVVKSREDEDEWHEAISAYLRLLKKYEERARDVGVMGAVRGRVSRSERFEVG